MLLKDNECSTTPEKPWYRLWPKDVPKCISYPETSLGNLLSTSAEKHPNRTALIYFDNKIAYRELDLLSNRFARAISDLGVKKGDRIALFLPNVPQCVIAFYGAVKAGAIVVTISPICKEREVEYLLRDSGTETIVALDLFYPILSNVIEKTKLKNVIIGRVNDYMPKTKSALGTILGKVPVYSIAPRSNLFNFRELIRKYDSSLYRVEINPKNDVAVIQYTGGITGTPKGAMLTHMNLVSNTLMCAKWIGTESDASYLSILPISHIYGLMTGLFAPLYIGAKVVLFPKFDPRQVLQSIQKYRIVVFCGVPTLYDKLLTNPDLNKYDYSSLKYCISGSAPLPQELKKRFMNRFGCILVEGYGLSEASPITHCNPLESSEESKIGSIGVPWPDTDAKVVDQEKGERVLKPGEIGELIISGPQIMKGYWNMPDETASALRDGWLYTGDLGKMDEDGYFYIIDRKKDLIKYKGHSIYPQELEEVLYEHPAVRYCCVVGKSDPVVGEVPKAFVVLSEDATVTESDIMKFVNDRVAYYKAIREVEFRKILPTNEVGKVIKRSLVKKKN